MKKIAVLVSNAGTGSNLQAIIDAIKQKKLKAKIVVVVSDTKNAYGLVRAKKNKIPTFVVNKKTDLTYLLQKKYKADLVALSGWKQIIPDSMLQVFSDRILNIHPGLIPDTFEGTVQNPDGSLALWNRGKFTNAAIQNFLDKKVTYAGSTVHFLSNQFDFGTVLAKDFEKIKKNDTVQSLYERLKKKEHIIYVRSLQIVCNGNINTKKTILVIGSGGREHALGWKLAQSPKVGKLFFAPGNAGTALIGDNVNISASDIDSLLQFALEKKIDLTVVGPDDTLALGVVDRFKKNGLHIFGPTKDAAQLEWSKAFAKKFMQDEKIPTASYKTFRSYSDAKMYLQKHVLPVVIKASGLALGKGVIIAQTKEEAEEAVKNIMVKKIFGDAGNEVVIEEFLTGKEVSIHAFCDGKTAVFFPTAMDHKSIFENNKGPNTGGMGTIAPIPFVSKREMENINKTIVMPVINGMRKRGIPFSGCLYPGLMITKEGPKVLEFNVRFGDPETQSYMRLLKTDLYDIFMACSQGKLKNMQIQWEKKSACCIVVASASYPGSYIKGKPIFGLDTIENKQNIVIFHAGTKKYEGNFVTNGGRVLGVSATGNSLRQALKNAYGRIGKKGIHFAGMQFRKDIGKKALGQK